MSAVRIRRPAVAGTFYPADPAALERSVASHLAEARAHDTPRAARDEHPPKALIVPHAGYVFSGPIAASAYVRIACLADRVHRVVLLGPSHRVYVQGLAASSADVFATPLGEIRLDREAIERALALPQVQLLDAAHRDEHSLEVQLPFLQRVLTDFLLVPFSVGDASVQEVAEVLDLLWGGDETLVVVSSDLSHYYDYATARRLDAATSQAIEDLDPAGLDSESACGRVPVRGLLDCARRRGLHARTLDLRNSGDTAGSHDQVVGYGAYAFA
jgi:AmmeMemoRadiSam system protein B